MFPHHQWGWIFSASMEDHPYQKLYERNVLKESSFRMSPEKPF